MKNYHKINEKIVLKFKRSIEKAHKHQSVWTITPCCGLEPAARYKSIQGREELLQRQGRRGVSTRWCWPGV
jgi:hypothetical protein